MKKRTVQSETKRLRQIFSGISKNQQAVVEGLIDQVARMRIMLDELSEDIEKNGVTEMFSQSDKVEPYVRERPAASLFLRTDKNYQSAVKQLVDLCPPDAQSDELAEFLEELKRV